MSAAPTLEEKGGGGSGSSPTIRMGQNLSNLYKWYQFYVDKTTPHMFYRWIGFAFLLVMFMVRIVQCRGFYVIAYALGIYLLNIFLLFLSPRFDPASAEEDYLANDTDVLDVSNRMLPVGRNDEFRPFVRRLPEFRFWYNATWATTVSLLATAFSMLDIPVFWPILLFYFIMLTTLTLRRQIGHMIKYKYVPFDFGKKQYSRS